MSASVPNQLEWTLINQDDVASSLFFFSIPDISLVWRSDIYSSSSIKGCHLGEIGYYIIILLCFALRHLSFLRTKISILWFLISFARWFSWHMKKSFE